MDGEVQLAEDGGEVGEDECRYPHDHHGPGLQGAFRLLGSRPCSHPSLASCNDVFSNPLKLLPQCLTDGH